MPIQIAEGEAKTGSGNDTLVFPRITSCLAILSIDGANHRGGHAVLVPDGNQLDLQGICDYLGATGQRVQIKGDIGTWNQNWQNMPQTRNLRINGRTIRSVEEMANALSTGQVSLVDTNGNTQDVSF